MRGDSRGMGEWVAGAVRGDSRGSCDSRGNCDSRGIAIPEAVAIAGAIAIAEVFPILPIHCSNL